MMRPDEPRSPAELAEPVIHRIPRAQLAPAQRVESGDIIVHREPRISANKLAEYVMADPSRQKTIIKEAKFAKKAVIIPYTRVRTFISQAFTGVSLSPDLLSQKAGEIERAKYKNDWQQRDNERSSLALKNIAELTSALSWKNATLLHKPSSGWGHLEMAGVKVSVQPELVFSFEHRNITKVGAILLSTAIRDEKSLARKNGSHCVGDYLSSLLFQMLVKRLHNVGAPLNSKCFAVDVFRKQVHTAPASYRTLNRHMEAACEVIALRWPEIKQQG